MVIKFTPTVVKFTLIGVCNLVGMSADFDTLEGMLIVTVVKFNIGRCV